MKSLNLPLSGVFRFLPTGRGLWAVPVLTCAGRSSQQLQVFGLQAPAVDAVLPLLVDPAETSIRSDEARLSDPYSPTGRHRRRGKNNAPPHTQTPLPPAA